MMTKTRKMTKTRNLNTRKQLSGLRAVQAVLMLGLLLGMAGEAGAQAVYVPPAQPAPTLGSIPGLQTALNAKAPFNPIGVLVAPLVGTNTTANFAGHMGAAGDTMANCQSVHILCYDTTAFKLTWENNQTHPITLTAAIWTPGGTIHPTTPLQVTWNGGQTSVTIPAANGAQPSFVSSDWIAFAPNATFQAYSYSTKVGSDSGAQNLTQTKTSVLNYTGVNGTGFMPANTPFYVREFVTGTAGSLPGGLLPTYGVDNGSSHSTAEVDETMMTAAQTAALTPAYTSGAVTGGWGPGNTWPDSNPGNGNTSLIYCPSAIQGQVAPGQTTYSLAVYGDSISNGTGDTWSSAIATGPPNNYPSSISGGGAIVRACEQTGIPIMQAGIYGAGFGNTDGIFYPLATGCTHVIMEMGINYIRAVTDGTNNANVAANTTLCINAIVTTMKTLKRRNPTVKFILWTYPPATDGTGKVPGASNNTRVAINDYIRANYAAMGAVDYVDAANTVEATPAAQGTLTQDGGAWYTGGNGGTALTTVDGTHPNSYGHGFIAAAIIAKINAGMLAK